MQRLIPGAVLGRVSAIFLTGEAALARLTVPRMPVSRADGELRSFLLNGPVVTPTPPPSSSSR
jgi:hypothetical protein